jgi:hypothetical protein
VIEDVHIGHVEKKEKVGEEKRRKEEKKQEVGDLKGRFAANRTIIYTSLPAPSTSLLLFLSLPLSFRVLLLLDLFIQSIKNKKELK